MSSSSRSSYTDADVCRHCTHSSLSHPPRGNFKKILAKSADELEGEYLKLLDKARMLSQTL